MKNIALLILPCLTILLVYAFNQESQRAQQLDQQSKERLLQQKNLDFLLQNYFMGRIETLKLVNPSLSADLRKESQRDRERALEGQDKAILKMRKQVRNNQEELLLTTMISHLSNSRDIMIAALPGSSKIVIEEMNKARVPLRESMRDYAAYLGEEVKRLEDEQEKTAGAIHTLALAIITLQFLGIGYIFWYVRSVRS